MLEQLNWPIIVGESISGLTSGVISGLLILSVTYIINIFDNKRKKQAEKEFLLIKEEINNLGELSKVVDENIDALKSFKTNQDVETAAFILEKIAKQQSSTVDLVYTGVFNEANIKKLHEKYGPIQEILANFVVELSINKKELKIMADKDLLDEIIKMMTDFKRDIVVMKKDVFLEI
ncbi:hypothetical protein ACRCJZ_05300 [Aerococcus urinaeequi]|uniref:hypothetical protein n=1 Tax=Aerococcus urinaeequi TaxID=51665 RepID=UPI0024319549|nr:hypothetical protein [Aerococcus urinaeequi]